MTGGWREEWGEMRLFQHIQLEGDGRRSFPEGEELKVVVAEMLDTLLTVPRGLRWVEYLSLLHVGADLNPGLFTPGPVPFHFLSFSLPHRDFNISNSETLLPH